MTGDMLRGLLCVPSLSKNLQRQLHRLTYYGALIECFDMASNFNDDEGDNRSLPPFGDFSPIDYITEYTSGGVNLRTGQSLPCGIGPLSGDIELSGEDVVNLHHVARCLTWMRPVPLYRRLSDILGDWNNSEQTLAASHTNMSIVDDVRGHLAASNAQGCSVPTVVWMTIVVCIELTLKSPVRRFMSLIIPLLYGGIHFITWKGPFSSTAEQAMWKSACAFIMAGIPIAWVFTWMALCLSTAKERLESETVCKRFTHLYVTILITLIAACLGFVLTVTLGVALGRLFVVVELFLNLRSAPIGIFWTPSWIQMVPHM